MGVASSMKNEHIKLLVTYLNSIAVTLFFAGVIGPLAKQVMDGVSGVNASVIAFWCFCSFFVHAVAHSLFSELEFGP